MKLRKAFALISLIVLVGCGHKKTSSSIVQEDSSSSSLVNDETTSSSLSSSKTSSSKISASYSSLSINIRSNSRTSSNQTVEHSVTFNFYNPSCGTFSTEVLNERLATYMNEIAKADIVTSISNTKCTICFCYINCTASCFIFIICSSSYFIVYCLCSICKICIYWF